VLIIIELDIANQVLMERLASGRSKIIRNSEARMCAFVP
jgi:hypothetical protein